MRLFFALWPDEATRARLADLQQGLKGRTTRRPNLHMTLAFLGEQPQSLLCVLHALLHGLDVPPLSLTLDHLVYRKRQRMVWAGMSEVSESLLAMQSALSLSLEQAGIAFDRRTHFSPHVTLARDAAPPDLLHFEPVAWEAREVVLVQSIAEPEGVAYRVLASRYAHGAAGESAMES